MPSWFTTLLKIHLPSEGNLKLSRSNNLTVALPTDTRICSTVAYYSSCLAYGTLYSFCDLASFLFIIPLPPVPGTGRNREPK